MTAVQRDSVAECIFNSSQNASILTETLVIPFATYKLGECGCEDIMIIDTNEDYSVEIGGIDYGRVTELPISCLKHHQIWIYAHAEATFQLHRIYLPLLDIRDLERSALRCNGFTCMHGCALTDIEFNSAPIPAGMNVIQFQSVLEPLLGV